MAETVCPTPQICEICGIFGFNFGILGSKIEDEDEFEDDYDKRREQHDPQLLRSRKQ